MMNRRDCLRWLAGAVLASGTACRQAPAGHSAATPASTAGSGSAAAPSSVKGVFHDATAAARLQFTHSWGERSRLLPEDMGSGLAWGDYDNDGYPDLYVVNQPGPFGGPAHGPGNRLFRNNRNGTFTDVTEEAGLELVHFGMGAYWADFDNDGHLDLFVTGQNGCHLYHNEGNGRFRDITRQAGVFTPGWSTGAIWFDFDNDGWLDLYVAHYVDYPADVASLHLSPAKQYNLVVPPALNPQSFEPQPNRLFRNNRDGTFTDVTARAGVADRDGRSLTVTAAPFGRTHRSDLYVGNDLSMNRYFAQQPAGHFLDRSAQTWLAENKGTMGLAVRDVDGDGALDLFIAHWLGQGAALYQNLVGASADGQPTFTDIADPMQLAYVTLPMVSWGSAFVDLDNAGHPDLVIVNGNTLENAQDHRQLVPQKPFIFRWTEDGYTNVAEEVAPEFNHPWNARGLAVADYDRDGDLDLAVSCNRGPLRLLRADGAEKANWLKINLQGTKSNRPGIGALVHVTTHGKTQMQCVGSQGSYLSQHALELHFGLGTASTAERVRVDWPSGHTQIIHHARARQVLTLREDESV